MKSDDGHAIDADGNANCVKLARGNVTISLMNLN